MNEVREGTAHKLKPSISGISLNPSRPETRLRTHTRIQYQKLYFILLLDLGNLAVGLRVLTVYSNSHSQNLTHFYYYDYKNNHRKIYQELKECWECTRHCLWRDYPSLSFDTSLTPLCPTVRKPI